MKAYISINLDNSLRESVKFRYLCSNIRTFLSNFVATDVYALLLKSYPEDFRPILSWASSNPILGQNLSSTPASEGGGEGAMGGDPEGNRCIELRSYFLGTGTLFLILTLV